MKVVKPLDVEDYKNKRNIFKESVKILYDEFVGPAILYIFLAFVQLKYNPFFGWTITAFIFYALVLLYVSVSATLRLITNYKDYTAYMIIWKAVEREQLKPKDDGIQE